jgi:NAD(P)-dependent dehydrogenase (short-subunit alcohol dehydrogenase family)
MLAKVPAGRLGHPQDITAMVRYLLSDDASYVTGQVLTIDGGLQA